MSNTKLVKELVNRICKKNKNQLEGRFSTNDIFNYLQSLENQNEDQIIKMNSTVLANCLQHKFNIYQSRSIIQQWKNEFELGN